MIAPLGIGVSRCSAPRIRSRVGVHFRPAVGLLQTGFEERNAALLLASTPQIAVGAASGQRRSRDIVTRGRLLHRARQD